MKNIPQEIYLQIGTERDLVEDFKELREVTWSEDRINKSDINFVLADVVCCPKCKTDEVWIGTNKTEVEPQADGNYRDIEFDICKKCGYAISVRFFD